MRTGLVVNSPHCGLRTRLFPQCETMNSAEIAIGHFLIGVAINILLYGIMITQMYLYFATYKRPTPDQVLRQ